jgi:GT2 family glycosyltransferase
MNNDVRAEPAWLRALTAALDARPEVGSVASRMLDAKRPGIIDAAGDAMALVAWNVGRGEPDGPRFATGREVLSACAGAAAYRRAVFDRVGTLDERYFAWFEDVDLGLRAQIAGFRCWYEPTAVVHHLGSATGARMSDLKVFYAYRNAMLLFFKTMPLRRVLAWGLVMLIWPWLAPAALGVPLRPTLRGWLAFFPLVPHVLRTRRGTYARRRVPVRNLMRLLDSPLDDFARVWGSLSTRLRGRSRQAGVGARGAAA